MPFEQAKDNQWWYSKSELRRQVENCSEIILRVNGRACRMRHAAPAKDGRTTQSFTFLDAEDRVYWRKRAKAGAMVDIQLGETVVGISDFDPGVTRKNRAMPGGLPTEVPKPAATLAPLTVGQMCAAGRRSGVDEIYIGIDIGGWKKGMMICALYWNGNGIGQITSTCLRYAQQLPDTDVLNDFLQRGDIAGLAAATFVSARANALRLRAQLNSYLADGSVIRGIFIDSPSAFSRNTLGHGRLCERVGFPNVTFQMTPSIACGKAHNNQWNWLLYGMQAFLGALFPCPTEADWLGALANGLQARMLAQQSPIVRECFPTLTVEALRKTKLAAAVQQLLNGNPTGAIAPEVAAVEEYLQHGVREVKESKPLYDRADALVAALTGLPLAFPQQFSMSQSLPGNATTRGWTGGSPDAQHAEGAICVVV